MKKRTSLLFCFLPLYLTLFGCSFYTTTISQYIKLSPSDVDKVVVYESATDIHYYINDDKTQDFLEDIFSLKISPKHLKEDLKAISTFNVIITANDKEYKLNDLYLTFDNKRHWCDVKNGSIYSITCEYLGVDSIS